MGTDGIIVIPPLLKVVSGPLLGPAMLVGASRAAGQVVTVLDLNWCWIRERLPRRLSRTPAPFVGDHDRPSEVLSTLQRELTDTLSHAGSSAVLDGPASPWSATRQSHQQVLDTAHRVARSPLGQWMRQQLAAHDCPRVLGISVMYSGQVVPALVVSVLARELWPDALVAWGGAHVTALGKQISADHAYGACVDRFVIGYAECTWVQLVESAIRREPPPETAIVAGSGKSGRAIDDGNVLPVFDDLDTYDWGRLTLPAQLSRGCAYGRCTFCTYPQIEGGYRALQATTLLPLLEDAARLGAAVSFKDSLVVPPRLKEIASLVDGRVCWSACTKLSQALTRPVLRRLAASGCATLELGLETLSPRGQLLIDKSQSEALFSQVLDAAGEAGIALVVNYMTGFPGADRIEELRYLDLVRSSVEGRANLVGKVEHNSFELERLSPMGQSPERFGLRITRTWPWESVVEWEPLARAGAGSVVGSPIYPPRSV